MGPPERACARLAVTLVTLGFFAAGAAFAAARPVDPLDAAKLAIRLKNFGSAALELQRLAAAGNSQAQYLLAAFYLNGLTGPRDPAQARHWLEKSAEQGYAPAAFSLATLLATAEPADPEAASHWLARARELGSDGSQRQERSAVARCRAR
jgi:TPR repeat protein